MSVGSTIRSVAFATAAAATLLVASSSGVAAQQTAQATIPPTNAAVNVPSTTNVQPLSKEECKTVAGVYIKVVNTAQTSEDFRNSMIAWVNPSSFGCDGPKNIVIRTGTDSDAFVTIRDILSSGTRPINIMTRGGLRAIGPTAALGSGG